MYVYNLHHRNKSIYFYTYTYTQTHTYTYKHIHTYIQTHTQVTCPTRSGKVLIHYKHINMHTQDKHTYTGHVTHSLHPLHTHTYITHTFYPLHSYHIQTHTQITSLHTHTNTYTGHVPYPPRQSLHTVHCGCHVGKCSQSVSLCGERSRNHHVTG